MTKVISREEMKAAFDKVFGSVNTAATRRDGETEMRVGKTKTDKAKGHTPYKKNVRIFEGGSSGRKGGSAGQWVKR